jgi:pentatricopeptide repeat protein
MVLLQIYSGKPSTHSSKSLLEHKRLTSTIDVGVATLLELRSYNAVVAAFAARGKWQEALAVAGESTTICCVQLLAASECSTLLHNAYSHVQLARYTMFTS